MEIIIILFLILLNGFFAMSEISVVSARRSRLEAAAKKGNAGARKAVEMAENPSRFLSTVQVGITLIGILTGLYGGEALSIQLKGVLDKIDFIAPYSEGVAVTLVVIVITYFSIVLGELLPKRIGLTMPERIASFVSRPMNLLSKIAAPFIWLLSKSTEGLIKLFGIRKTDESHVTEEEIRAIVQEGTEAGSIEEIEQDLVENVFHLGDRAITSLMTPRHEIVWINSQKPFEDQIEEIVDAEKSVFPVCNGSLDEFEGIYYLREYAKAALTKTDTSLETLLRKPLFFPEGIKAYKVLEQFQESRVHFGVIVDEYGSIQGVVTLNDLLDALVGDIILEEENEVEIVKREDGSWLVNGTTAIETMLEALGEDIRTERDADYNTVAGLVLHHAEHIPKAGFSFDWRNYKVEVIDMDGHKIDKVLITKK
ncbi:hemolysin family protein [Chitinophagaceae bacterium LB-8]|uniref:Hemolysin family protein n=1 Tax=Paraflavisolibacter caeni TaxID=2982496 RepID=A0A9X2XUV3_9BACT|nr:hemolysin family protein [Paraflavisolibacter caeni]MCU7549315.1 hemolysin family protein [Paraflavisolibacter caeni]